MVTNRQILESQLKENEVVLKVRNARRVYFIPKELEFVQDTSAVYKLVGSVMLRQERSEAVTNVTKRIEYIKNEM